MKAEVDTDLLAKVLELLFGKSAPGQVSHTYATIRNIQAEADMAGFERGYRQAEHDGRGADHNPESVNAFQQRLEKEHNGVALCGTRLGDDEIVLFQRDSGDETDYD